MQRSTCQPVMIHLIVYLAYRTAHGCPIPIRGKLFNYNSLAETIIYHHSILSSDTCWTTTHTSLES